jgi:hypothetical protein
MDTTTIRNEIAELVTDAMKQSGHNPTSLSRATGIPRTSLLRMLDGHDQFGTVSLTTVAEVLDKSFLDLIPTELKLAA